MNEQPKHHRGDKHPTKELFFWAVQHGRECWVTAKALAHRRKGACEVSKRLAVANREKRNARLRDYNRRHPEARKARRLKWIKAHPKLWAEYQRRYIANKRAKNVLFRLRGIMQCRIRAALKAHKFQKHKRTFEILGCTPAELRSHIEQQFKRGMSWAQMGKIHIDHKTPVASAKNKRELLDLCHYTNLQPLWAKENLEKSDKIAA
jgi:hypothetical protein